MSRHAYIAWIVMLGAAASACSGAEEPQRYRVATASPSTGTSGNEKHHTWSAYRFADWDRNRDQQIVASEFQHGLTNAPWYSEWDRDDDGFITREELSRGLYQSWDTDRNQLIDADEFRQNARLWFRDRKIAGAFTRLDADENDFLDYPELLMGINELGIFQRWDKDNDARLSLEEYSRGLLDTWDLNQDQTLTEAEWYW